MRIVREEVLIDEGEFGKGDEYAIIHRQITEAISQVVWPEGSTQFTIYPEKTPMVLNLSR